MQALLPLAVESGLQGEIVKPPSQREGNPLPAPEKKRAPGDTRRPAKRLGRPSYVGLLSMIATKPSKFMLQAGRALSPKTVTSCPIFSFVKSTSFGGSTV